MSVRKKCTATTKRLPQSVLEEGAFGSLFCAQKKEAGPNLLGRRPLQDTACRIQVGFFR